MIDSPLEKIGRLKHRMSLPTALLLGVPGLLALGALWFFTRQPKAGSENATPPSAITAATPAPSGSPHSPGSQPSPGASGPGQSPAATAQSPTAGTQTTPPAIPLAAGAPSSNSPAPVTKPLDPGELSDIQPQLEEVHLMLRDYRSLTGENPVGTNAEIMKAMMGDNPKKAALGPPAGQRLNGDGELLDPWGKPYFFHQLSSREMEIRSAGPDGQMWTSDDQTMTSGSGAAPRAPK